jgi:hypothetical protein
VDRTALRDQAARAALVIATELGGTLDYTPAGAAAITALKYVPDQNLMGQTLDADTAGGRDSTDEQTTHVYIPRQTGFPPTGGLKPGATVKLPATTGSTYDVVSARGDQETTDLSAGFHLILSRNPGAP